MPGIGNLNFSSDLGLDFTGGLGLDVDGDLLKNIGFTLNDPLPVIKLAPINLNVAVTDLPTIKTESTVGLDLKVAVTELPKIRLEFGLQNMRMHFPTHYQFCFSVLGLEVFKFALCGESMVGIEPYVPHQTERCG